jgi:hypothetical protein
MRTSVAIGLVFALAGLAGCGGGGGGGDRPEVFVTTLADSGPGSLRQVVADAPSGAVVRFDAGLSGDIALVSEILLDEDVRIEGPGAATVRLTAAVPTLGFRIPDGVDVHVSGLALVGVGGGGTSSGGAIESFGSLELEEVVIEDAVGSRGGGVWSGGPLEMRDCTIRGCSAFNGGGVSCDGGTARIERCTFEDNFSDGNSAAALLVGDGVHASCVNCTFGSNFTVGADRVGGAIAVFTEHTAAELDLAFCTIAENTATGPGGGIYLDSMATLRIRNCIVAGNVASEGPDIHRNGAATVTTFGHNVIGDGTNSGMSDGVLGDQVGSPASPIDPLLGPRTFNGGPTETYALLAGSPARDAVPDSDCEDVDGDDVDEDQRGEPRSVGAACDAGAYEG